MVMRLRIESPFQLTGNPEEDPYCIRFPPTREFDAWVDDDMDTAQQICNGLAMKDGTKMNPCPRRHDCLMFALVNNEHYGVWGGLRPEQRHDMRQRFKNKRNKTPHPQWCFENARPTEDILAEQEANGTAEDDGTLCGPWEYEEEDDLPAW